MREKEDYIDKLTYYNQCRSGVVMSPSYNAFLYLLIAYVAYHVSKREGRCESGK